MNSYESNVTLSKRNDYFVIEDKNGRLSLHTASLYTTEEIALWQQQAKLSATLQLV